MRFGASTAVGVEGAYFFNKYVGVGGRLRVNSSPIKGWAGVESYALNDLDSFLHGDEDDEIDSNISRFIDGEGTPGTAGYSHPLVETMEFNIKSDHLTEFAADLGLYF